ncbi:hypothetical protein Tco_1197565, partial [Tanacetum coccineum]
SESYKEYYAIASGKVPPKTKASVHKKKSDSDTTPKENVSPLLNRSLQPIKDDSQDV